jgi:glucose/arabinose dehydrogenase
MVLAIVACAEVAQLPISAGTGSQPTLPPPQQRSIPTVNIAPAKGWPAGATPVGAPGTRVVAFASELDHPRWLYVLPNGDVLVAETNAPSRPANAQGVKGWLMGLAMKSAGAGVPSANRITLLRDTDGDGIADQRTVLLDGLNSPFGMVLVGNDLYVANSDAIVRFSYNIGDTRIATPGGPHTASLGLASSVGNTLPATFADGMFVGQHGAWNRRQHSGYKVIFVPFEHGRPSGGAPVDVLTGSLSANGDAYGRPVGVVVDHQGALLVADDVGNVVWRVSAAR